ncbi:hypothetical protein D9M68_872980 [compost metagenome]
MVQQRRRHRADALQIGIAHRGAALFEHLPAQMSDGVFGIELLAQFGRRARQFGFRQRANPRVVLQGQEHAARGGPQHRQHRTHPHVHRHGQARLFKAHDGRPLVAHDGDEARYLQVFAQADQPAFG